MGLKWKTFLDDIEVDEPIGMDQVTLSIIRDDELHGIGMEATTSSLGFFGVGADYIESVKTCQGLRGQIVFKAQSICGDDSGTYQDVIVGKVNLGAYKKTCGINGCIISVPIESVTCETILRNNYDQQVDVDKKVGLDGITVLADYPELGVNMTLPARGLSLIDQATDSTQRTERISDQTGWFVNVPADEMLAYLTPAFDNTLYSALGEFSPGAFLELFNGGFLNNPDPTNNLQPVTVNAETLLGDIKCALSNVVVDFRLKGSATSTGPGGSTVLEYIIFRKIKDLDPTLPTSWVTEYSTIIASCQNTETNDWDVSASVPIPSFEQGDWLICSIFVHVTNLSGVTHFDVTQDPETFLKISAASICEDSETAAYFVHETLSRVTEAITNSCCRVKSTYYGRQDSLPFGFDTDGCGGLRFLTSGLKIRRAPNASFFTSLKTLITGLQCIDNIGMGLEVDPDLPNNLLLRVEGLDFFYRNEEIFSCPGISEGTSEIEESRAYIKIQAGYKNWEIKNTNGLDEFNSTREYRTSLATVNNVLDITCDLVAAGYVIEITRQQSFADTGAADTTYDNNVFIILMKRGGEIYTYAYPYGQLLVEQGNITDPENIFDPATIYNYGISPVRNLFRWFRSIAASYPNIIDSENKISFNSGTGNFLAKGELSAIYGGSCRIEALPIQENQDVFTPQFLDPAAATPLWINETITFDYPMSLADYKRIKANPYGYVSFQCGSDDFQQGWIKEIKYSPVQGIATLVLRKKWGSIVCQPFVPPTPEPPPVDEENFLAWDTAETQAQAWDTASSQEMIWTQ